MQDPPHQVIVQRRLEQVLVTFFVGCALYVVVVYVAAPSVYTTALMLSAATTTRSPFPATLFLVALLV